MITECSRCSQARSRVNTLNPRPAVLAALAPNLDPRKTTPCRTSVELRRLAPPPAPALPRYGHEGLHGALLPCISQGTGDGVGDGPAMPNDSRPAWGGKGRKEGINVGL